MKKAFIKILLIIILILTYSATIYALDANISIIEESAETKYLDNDQGYISKKVVDSDEEKGEVTIEVKLSNTPKDSEKDSTAEVIFVVDNSGSMSTKVINGMTRKRVVVDATQLLVNELYIQNPNIKTGLVKFSSSANLMCELTNDKQVITQSIEQFSSLNTESDTNIIAGMNLANNSFSTESKNRIIVLLTDGVPSQSDVLRTKEALLSIANSGTYIISMVTDISDSSVNTIFGTEEQPTTGKFYNITNTSINEIISKNIFQDIMDTMQNPLTEITITDYLPIEMVENFTLTYVEKPSEGTVIQKVDNNGSRLVWKIDILNGNDETSFKYKLKLRDNYNKDILKKELKTNEKLEMTYNDFRNKGKNTTIDSSPKIKVTSKQSNNNGNNNNNDSNGNNNQDGNNGDNGSGNSNNQNNSGNNLISNKNGDTTIRNGSLPLVGAKITLLIIILVSIVLVIILWRLNIKYRAIK